MQIASSCSELDTYEHSAPFQVHADAVAQHPAHTQAVVDRGIHIIKLVIGSVFDRAAIIEISISLGEQHIYRS